MISNTLSNQINKALKEKDETRLSTLRLLSSELHNAEIDKKGDLTKDEEILIVRKEAKKRKDAIEAYRKAGAKGRAEQEKKELEILQEYLPKELSDEDQGKIVDAAIQESGVKDIKDMGKVMGLAMGKTKGQADGGRVSEIVKRKLS